MAACLRCKKEFGGFWGAKKALPFTIDDAVKLGIDPNGLCEDCLLHEVKRVSEMPSPEEQEHLEALSGMIVSTTAHPEDWTKDIVGVVNGFSVIGTGLFAELFSTITDFVGMESKSYHDKLVKAKNNAILRAKEEAVSLGANMIFGLQVNINEISAAKGMLLVAVTGTALKHEV